MYRVLIVEDDPMVAKINKTYIEKVEGFKIIGICKDEVETLKFIRKNKIDLIILDVYLPRGDGISILNKLRLGKINSDVIMVTASNEVDKIEETLKLGVIDYLIKPFEFERLKQALEKYKSRKGLLKGKDDITQEELDKLLNKKNKDNKDNKDNTKTPKGLNKYTLNSIINFLKNNDIDAFTAEEISLKLDVSKVTIRKYMDYLEDLGYIVKKIEYGNLGRPSYIYEKID